MCLSGLPLSCFASALNRQLPSPKLRQLSFPLLQEKALLVHNFNVLVVVGIGIHGSFAAAVPGRAMNVG